ncbi:sigma factor [Thermosipho melanesiensis]|uniref:protein acetyllysine N-acetyltransferase n=2 Tax=Thermosipho melanesiensis TaxID=46541 RepID=A6LP94_THEM4|nr:NAD-dependent deacylase [Thermosipho melanesiensis]ABR31745.1 Silent information regulator protein Sir2 [Thermosipho melanesiensis BI429]APT74767.1 sigma factor [Thermosipho melanesiensis]OOC35086.1 sigma factor [Thermosipho melanesiensis]OOC35122.1 sigma factor [Thermosipho melanesiensis]OOC36730.1 sigma factor [Thermosipho melanesiensis]
MLEDIIEILEEGNVVALTGAGISTSSGIPDFRSEDGLYKEYGYELFSYEFFKNHPDIFYEYIKKEFPKMYKANYNMSHKLLAELEEMGYLLGVITQNIDDLHNKAGSRNVIELHGNATHFYCEECERKYSFPKEYICSCGGLIRPDIVFFGEPVNDIDRVFELLDKAETLLVMGTSLQVYPASNFPVYVKERGGILIIVNREETQYDNFADFVLHMNVEEFSKKVLKYFEEEFD